MDILLKNILGLIDANYQKDEDFEKEFGIAKSTVSAWRRGKLMSYQKYATKIASFFNVSSDWLSGNEQKNKPAAESDELDPLDIEFLKRFKQLDDEGKKLVSAQIDAIIAFRQQKK